MGSVPAKYFLPSSPYGASPASNVLSPSQPGAVNPQTPLLPPNFTDPGTMQQSATPAAAKPLTSANRQTLPGAGGKFNFMDKLYGNMY